MHIYKQLILSLPTPSLSSLFSCYFPFTYMISEHKQKEMDISLSLKTCISSFNCSKTNIFLLTNTEFSSTGFCESLKNVGYVLVSEGKWSGIRFITRDLLCFKLSKTVSFSGLISDSHYDFMFELKAFYLQESKCP